MRKTISKSKAKNKIPNHDFGFAEPEFPTTKYATPAEIKKMKKMN